MNLTHETLRIAIRMTEELLLEEGELVSTSSWQGQHREDGSLDTFEITNVSFTTPVPSGLVDLQAMTTPNLPWVEEHFQERISRVPYNPPPSHTRWPFWRASSEATREVDGNKFSHSYPERYWCPAKPGIRYAWGNLDSVVELLYRDPFTRQAYLPVFFPEDTGAGATGIGYTPRRIPCTLGYGFLHRGNQLHMFYDIRSCDALRHFFDDTYLSCRLLLWVLDELRGKEGLLGGHYWDGVSLGTITVHIYSFHIFKGDLSALKYKLGLGKMPKDREDA